jgi:U3 small nucleolar RNA-associated protein 4
MDIHRCRFIPYVPHAINAVAFSHPSSPHAKDKGPSALRLAVGRANGDLELWNPLKGHWVQETIFRGGKDRSIEGLAWTQDPKETDERGNKLAGRLRLFSHGYSATITEWDLEQAKPARHAHGDSGEIWCMASQPRWQGSDNASESEFKGQHLAAGCADGSIVIFSTADGDLTFKKTLTRPSTKRARVLSIVFQNRNIIVAGYADSTIRVFDIRNGRLLRSVSLGSGPKGKKADILVWSVQTLPDGTIISGDSSGEIRFWDATNYSLFQRIHSHKADVLDIVASADGERLMSGGADARTIVYQLKSGKRGDKQRRWAELSHRRFHTHDVKTMAVFETKMMSIVASGGKEWSPIILIPC